MRYLPGTASKARLREAENARKNRIARATAASHRGQSDPGVRAYVFTFGP
jgi:hypothetical protein